MCGICGFTGELLNRDRVLKDMADKIIHRGPDSCGYFSNPEISMGFRRLSIIDLEAGDQPIFNEDKTLVLTFNGEIYNYKELREELQRKGHIFATHTDSEVLIHGFEEWREGLLNRLRGMFGFAIWNTVDKSLFIARDFFGIKPMHYTKVGDHLVYGSEIKSILQFPGFEKKFNYDTLNNYLSFQYAVPPQTFFENLYCLLPGHYLWYKNGKITTTRYWEAMFEPQNDMTEAQAVDKIEKVFANSVDTHKISDVEVGCFLSSGVDSSYVSTYFPGQKAFTVGFDFGEKYNEIDFAKRTADMLGIDNFRAQVLPEDKATIIEELNGEKIDIFEWSDNISELIANALSPSVGVAVIPNENVKDGLIVVVPDNQLSLAIGKRGKNARLALKLTNHKINIKSESEMQELGIDYMAISAKMQEEYEEKKAKERAYKQQQKIEELKSNEADIENIDVADFTYEDEEVDAVEEHSQDTLFEKENTVEEKEVDEMEELARIAKQNRKEKTAADVKEYTSKFESMADASNKQEEPQVSKPKKEKVEEEKKPVEVKKFNYEDMKPIYSDEELAEVEEQEYEDENAWDDDVDYEEYDEYYDD